MSNAMHLADLIQEEMKERGWSLDELVMNMGPHFTEKDYAVCKLSWEMFFSVRTPDIILGDTMAEQLADAFDVNKQLFICFHEYWRKSALEGGMVL